MEAVDFNKAPQGATHFLRYDSGYVVWYCVIEDGPNGLPIVNEWDSFNECWMPAIYGVEHYYSIGMEWIENPTPAPQAPAQPEAPKGATHRYEHAGSTAWYREVDGKLLVWRDGSWFASFFKSAQDLAQSCMLGKVTPLVADTAQQVDDDLTWLARNVDRKLALPEVTHISRAKRRGHVFGIFPDGAHPSAEHNWLTKDQWLDRRAELQNKPSWDDAPNWAVYLSQNSSGEWWWHGDEPTERSSLYYSGSCKYMMQCKGECLGDWRYTLEQRPEAMTTTVSQDDPDRLTEASMEAFAKAEPEQATFSEVMDWFERGELPPVGVWCEAYCDGAEPEKCKILAYHKQQVAVRWSQFNQGCLDVLEMPGWSFRPIHTERDELMDAITSQGFLARDGGVCGKIADAILAAGFKRDGGAA